MAAFLVANALTLKSLIKVSFKALISIVSVGQLTMEEFNHENPFTTTSWVNVSSFPASLIQF